MSLFAAVQQSANSLRVAELGLQVTGNNIANANTPGYLRQELVQSTAIGVRQGSLIVGYGVRAVGVVQKVDEFVVERMREALSDLSYNEELQSANNSIETALGELGDNDLSSSMSRFAGALNDLATQPGNNAIRSLVLQRGVELTERIQSVRGELTRIQESASQDVRGAADSINKLTNRIAELNRQIVEIEGGDITLSDAVGLRDDRLKALDELAQLVDLTAREQESGAVTVIVGGDYLVSDAIPREVVAVNVANGGESEVEIRFADTDAPLLATSGRLRGYYDARDGVAANFARDLDDFSATVIFEVNRIHSQGQGEVGFQELTSDYAASSPFVTLENAGLSGEVVSGSFIITVDNQRTGLRSTHDISISQQGFDSDTTVNDLVAQIDAIDGLNAQVSNDGRLIIDSESEAIQFSFSEDTSGVLAAFGVNSFFTGINSRDISVRAELLENPSLLAASSDGVGNGANNAIRIAEAFELGTDSNNGRSLRDIYEGFTIEAVQKINAQNGITEGIGNYYRTLEAEHFGVSGVSLDEEAIKMILYQRAFQASSRLITTASELLEVLVNMV